MRSFRRARLLLLVLLAATFIVYVLVANAGDPRSALYESADPGKEAKIAAMTDLAARSRSHTRLNTVQQTLTNP